MDFKITKIQKYGKGKYTSEKIGIQWYNVVYLHVYANQDHTQYYKVHFIHMFDAEDLFEFVNGGAEDNEIRDPNDTDVKTARDEYCWAAADSICNEKDIHAIIENCNNMIRRYA